MICAVVLASWRKFTASMTATYTPLSIAVGMFGVGVGVDGTGVGETASVTVGRTRVGVAVGVTGAAAKLRTDGTSAVGADHQQPRR